jgi:hypothetical protein
MFSFSLIAATDRDDQFGGREIDGALGFAIGLLDLRANGGGVE